LQEKVGGLMVSKTFCIYPWIHVYANPDGSVLPCCVADHRKSLGNLRTQTLKEVWNGDGYKNIRRKMLVGEKCEECSGCYQMENSGIESVRQSKNEKYKEFLDLVDNTNKDGSLDEVTLRHFDIRWSNICNFKCRSCSSTYSSTWAQEDISQGQKKTVYILAGGQSNDIVYDQFLPHLADIKTFYFAGGEPLLTDKHYDILEHLISIGRTDIKIEYNTNLSCLKYKNKSVIDLWKKFNDVSINASIDSWGDRAEYIREGTVWQDIEANIKTIQQEVPHVKLHTGSVISIFNLYTIPEFFNYLLDNKIFNKENFYPYFYNIINPNYYSANILPDNLKTIIINRLSDIDYTTPINNEIQKVITYLKNSTYNSESREEFIKTTMHYDRIRNRDFLKTFPELESLYL
jgi:radical SAM protein with 4Fe4S-binding SPASM domain